MLVNKLCQRMRSLARDKRIFAIAVFDETIARLNTYRCVHVCVWRKTIVVFWGNMLCQSTFALWLLRSVFLPFLLWCCAFYVDGSRASGGTETLQSRTVVHMCACTTVAQQRVQGPRSDCEWGAVAATRAVYMRASCWGLAVTALAAVWLCEWIASALWCVLPRRWSQVEDIPVCLCVPLG